MEANFQDAAHTFCVKIAMKIFYGIGELRHDKLILVSVSCYEQLTVKNISFMSKSGLESGLTQ